MKIFKLPDLGEGLPDATIREWHVKVGDTVKVDQPMVAMETAKALVDVPSPFDGKIEKFFGSIDDVIETGHPLVGFEGEGTEETKQDSGTVVGAIETSDAIINESATGINVATNNTGRTRATPAVRALARQLGVDIDRIEIKSERVTLADIQQAANIPNKNTATIPEGMQQLSPAKRAMVLSMNASHSEVAPVSIMDDADIDAWDDQQDITVRLIQAVADACKTEPTLNATFHGASMSYKLNDSINLGIAVDTPDGLFVPVIKDIAHQSKTQLREQINNFKEKAKTKTFTQDELRGATIMLSNFGSIAGRYANPIVVPPMVAIVGIGKLRKEPVAVGNNVNVHRIIPLSVTVDHRIITGGEAARFLGTMILSLSE